MKKKIENLSNEENLISKIENNLKKIKIRHPHKIEWTEIKQIQKDLCVDLNKATKDVIERKDEEFLKPQYKDKADILGKYTDNSEKLVIIEIDASRADQVAKKFVSRIALTLDKEVLCFSVCYQGCDRNNPKECSKYFEYCEELANCLSESRPKKLLESIF